MTLVKIVAVVTHISDISEIRERSDISGSSECSNSSDGSGNSDNSTRSARSSLLLAQHHALLESYLEIQGDYPWLHLYIFGATVTIWDCWPSQLLLQP